MNKQDTLKWIITHLESQRETLTTVFEDETPSAESEQDGFVLEGQIVFCEQLIEFLHEELDRDKE